MQKRLKRLMEWILIGVPIMSLVLGTLAWLRYGFDMPWFDDWRGYAAGDIHSLELNYLFHPTNDTMAPVGFFLDAMAQRYLDGNSVAYQFLSMTMVLGSLLALQWRLLRRVLGTGLATAACFSFTVFMLQPDSYWGRENLAYHQAVPLIFILLAIDCSIGSDASSRSSLRRSARGLLVFAAGIVAGFTYISGAFGALAAGIGIAVANFLIQRKAGSKDDGSISAGWLITAGAIAAAAQLNYAILPHAGTHTGIPMATPMDGLFWMFLLGKVARSLLLPPDDAVIGLVVTLIVLTLTLTAAGGIAWRARRSEADVAERRTTVIAFSIGAVVIVYLLMVAAGRTRFRPGDLNDALGVFLYAYGRFHFFWATLLWPWVAASLFLLARRLPRRPGTGLAACGLFFVCAVLWAVSFNGAYDHMTSQRSLAASKLPTARCLLEGLQKEGPIVCPGLIPPRFEDTAPDSYGAYAYGWNTGASFVRYFPVLDRAERVDKDAPFFALNRILGKVTIDQMDYDGDGVIRINGSDSKVFVQTNQRETLEDCRRLDVDIYLRSPDEDIVKLYYLTKESSDFDEIRSREILVSSENGRMQVLRFHLESQDGFKDPIRFDPATRPKTMEVKDIRFFCRSKVVRTP